MGPVAGDAGLGSTDPALLRTRAGEIGGDDDDDDDGCFLLTNYYVPGTMRSPLCIISRCLHTALPALEQERAQEGGNTCPGSPLL